MKKRFAILIYIITIFVFILWAERIDGVLQRREAIPEMEKMNIIIKYIESYYVEEIAWDKAFDASIQGILSELDPHSVYIPPEEAKLNEENFQGHYEGIGIQFDIIDDSLTVIAPIAGSPADRVGLIPGDKIIAIDSLPAVGISRDEVMRRLKGPKGSVVTVTVQRPLKVKPITFTITRDEIPIKSMNTYFIFQNDIGYISLNRFAFHTEEELDKALQNLKNAGMKRLILDLRWNAGGFLDQAVKVAARFIKGDKKIVETRGRVPAFNETYYTTDFGERTVCDIPLIILINEGSASASEIVAGAIQDYDRGLIAGTKSFGKGLVQREYPLPDDSRLRLTISKYYTPSGRLIQRPYKNTTPRAYYQGETPDSISVDSVIYYTRSGRKVYGQGGISPDTLLREENDISTSFLVDLIQKRVLFDVAVRYAASHQHLKQEFDFFAASFQPGDNLLQQVLDIAGSKGIDIPDRMDDTMKKYVRKRLRAEIARSLWDSDRYYQVVMLGDSLLYTAERLFPVAQKIISGTDSIKKRN
jgi:carboxyl-terminal processing protease